MYRVVRLGELFLSIVDYCHADLKSLLAFALDVRKTTKNLEYFFFAAIFRD